MSSGTPIVLSMAAAGLAAVLGCGRADGPTFPSPATWKPAGEFRFFTFSLSSLPDEEAFKDMVPRCLVWQKESSPGVWRHQFERISSIPRRADGTEAPFTLSLYPRPAMRPKPFFMGSFDHKDRERFAEFKEKHPGFLVMTSGEWVNDAILAPGAARSAIAAKRYPLTADESEEVQSREMYKTAFTDRRHFTTNLLRKTFNRIAEFCFFSPGDLALGDGCYCVDHLAADWGAGQLWMETSRNYRFWHIQLMFCRGAAAQYGIQFNWYVASTFSGYDSNGARDPGTGYLAADTPQLGISVSAVKRAMYMTYLSGAASFQRETDAAAWRHKKGAAVGRISEEGRIYADFWRFCKRNPRGVPYRPVAIVVPWDRGYHRDGGKAYMRFPYTRSDYLLDALVHEILEYDRNKTMAMQRAGVERVMANSRYGDVFDVIVPGTGRPETFRRALMEHAVAFLAGDFDFSPEDAAALAEFKSRGGRLADLHELVGEWTGDAGPYMRSDKPKLHDYPKVRKAADELVLPLHPFRVSGDIQLGFNRLADGWLVYLINNGGVKKFGDTVAEYSPEGACVTVSLKEFPVSEVRELVANEKVNMDEDSVSLTVPSGDVRVLKITQRRGK